MRRVAALAHVGLCAGARAVTVWNGVGFYRAWQSGQLRPGMPVPLSFVVCACSCSSPGPRSGRRRGAPAAAAAAVLVVTAGACVLLFPVAQVFFFGKTDYRRPADVAVVFGAQVHENGLASTSLNDRMTTAIRLYKDHLVKHILGLERCGGQRVQRGES